MPVPEPAHAPLPPPSLPGRMAGVFWSGVVHLFIGLIGLMGLIAVWSSAGMLLRGEEIAGAVVALLMGLVCSAVAVGFVYFAYVAGPAKTAREAQMTARHPGQPWMLRADWAARTMTDSSLATMIFLWVWVVGWWSAILFIWSVNRDKILAAAAASWWQGALGLIFPVGGLIGLTVAWQTTRSWWRYGRSTLRIDTLPGHLGDTFRGTIEANLGARPLQALQAEVACEEVSWRTGRDAKGNTTRERVVKPIWSQTTAIEPARILIAGARASIPVSVALPAGQPPCRLDDTGAGIQWRLQVRASEQSLQAFACAFEFRSMRASAELLHHRPVSALQQQRDGDARRPAPRTARRC